MFYEVWICLVKRIICETIMILNFLSGQV